MTPMWSNDGGNLCLAVYFLSVFSTCGTELQKVEKLTPSTAAIRDVGVKLCQVRCNEKGGCLSFEYNDETLSCRLSSDEAKKIQKRDGYIVQSKDHSYVLTGPCAYKTCNLNSRCLDTRSGKAVCLDATPSPVDCDDLSNATIKGDLEGVRRILSQNVDINCRVTKRRVTPVLTAAYFGRREVLEFLVSKGADASLPNAVGYIILHMASTSGDVATMKFALSLNIVDIDARTKWGRTAVSVAKYHKDWQVVRLLKSHGAHCSQCSVYVDGEGGRCH